MTASPSDLARALLFEQRLICLSERHHLDPGIRRWHIRVRDRLYQALTLALRETA